jgi:two-component system, NarL family, nitrate/nitrite response regulator NarL
MMGHFPKSGYPELAIGIVSTFDVWCTGMEHVTQQWGWTFAGRWRCPGEAFPQGCTRSDGIGFDLVIIASGMLDRPDSAGLFRPFKSKYSGRIIVAIEPGDAFSLQDFLSLDVEGLILTTASIEQVIDCIETVGHDRRWVDPGIRALLAPQQRDAQDHTTLSTRELQIAQLAASGLSNKLIARELGISDGTVKMHMHHVMAKLNVNSRFNLGQLDCLHGKLRPSGQFEPHLLEIPNKILPIQQY